MTSQTDFTNYLQTSVKEIEKELRQIANEWNSKDETNSSEIKLLNKRFTGSWFGGKMLRGTLVKLGYELASNKQSHAILKPAAAFEILHTALLVHDDIIDKSPKRRGKSAFHVHKNPHYGISQAICIGDLGISLSGKLIAESGFISERKNKALNYFLGMVDQTIQGEMLDVVAAMKHSRNEKQILQIHKMKTADYSLVGPLTVGAILAGATDDFLLKLKLFGEPLGIAYQIQDDILGMYGNQKKLGKSTFSDIEENKNTLLIMYALKHANKQQKELLLRYYGRKKITKFHKEKIKRVFLETGSLAYSQNKIIAFTTQAKKMISLLSKNKKKQKLLNDFIDFLVARKK